MKIKDIKSQLSKEMDAIVPDVLSKVKQVPIGQMIPFGSQEQLFRQKLAMRMLLATCLVFFSVLIFTASFFLSKVFDSVPPSSTYVRVSVAQDDVAHSIQLDMVVNKAGTISVIVSSKEEAVTTTLRNKKLKEALVTVIDKAFDLALLKDDEEVSVTILALNDVEDVAEQISKEQIGVMQRYFESKTVEAKVRFAKATKEQFVNFVKSRDDSAEEFMSIDQLASIVETWYLETYHGMAA